MGRGKKGWVGETLRRKEAPATGLEKSGSLHLVHLAESPVLPIPLQLGMAGRGRKAFCRGMLSYSQSQGLMKVRVVNRGYVPA